MNILSENALESRGDELHHWNDDKANRFFNKEGAETEGGDGGGAFTISSSSFYIKIDVYKRKYYILAWFGGKKISFCLSSGLDMLKYM